MRVTAVYGGTGLVKQAKDAAASHILVATPGRLEDLLARGAFKLENVSILVLDEADRMLDMGFRPAIDRIVAACPKDRQTLLFSATLDGETGRIANRYARTPAIHHLGPSPGAHPEIEHRFVQVADQDRVEALVRELQHDGDLTLVFVRTKHGADRLVKRLSAHRVTAMAMHGNKSQRQREHALARFGSGAVSTLVATDVAARGIDVDGISHVINFDPPADRETYIHRVGRTGRAGRRGIGITLHTPDQHPDVTKLAGQLGLDDGLHRTTGRRRKLTQHRTQRLRATDARAAGLAAGDPRSEPDPNRGSSPRRLGQRDGAAVRRYNGGRRPPTSTRDFILSSTAPSSGSL